MSDIFPVHEALLYTLANTHNLVVLFFLLHWLLYSQTVSFPYLSPNHAIRSTGEGFNEPLAWKSLGCVLGGLLAKNQFTR